jgi:hypothetical protein
MRFWQRRGTERAGGLRKWSSETLAAMPPPPGPAMPRRLSSYSLDSPGLGHSRSNRARYYAGRLAVRAIMQRTGSLARSNASAESNNAPPLGSAGALERWSAGALERWSPGALEPWSPGALESWSPGVLERWSPGALESWSAGALEPWSPGALEPWCPGALVSGVLEPYLRDAASREPQGGC